MTRVENYRLPTPLLQPNRFAGTKGCLPDRVQTPTRTKRGDERPEAVQRDSGSGSTRNRAESNDHVILSPRLVIIDFDLVIFGWGCSTTGFDSTGAGLLFSLIGGGVDWKDNGSETGDSVHLGTTLTGNVELLDLPASNGLSEKSFELAAR